MLYITWNILIFIITVGILITIHELGHFIAARLCKVTIQRFSIGFGYVLWKYKDKQNTEYVISAIPLGGYVKMLNKNDISIIENYNKHNQTFEDKTIWQRILIVISGSLFNIIFAILIYWSIFIIGIFSYRPIISNIIPNSIIEKSNIPCNVEIHSINNTKTPDWESVRLTLIDILNHKKKNFIISVIPSESSQIEQYFINLENWKYEINTQDILTSLGIVPLPTYSVTPILSKVEKNSPGMKSGLKIGDEIIFINDKSVHTWEIVTKEIKSNPEKILKIIIKRNNEILTIKATPKKKNTTNNKSEGYLGILPTYHPISKKYATIQKFGLIKSIEKAEEKVWKIICLTWDMLIKLIMGDMKLNNLGGPISIAQNAKDAAKYGILSYLTFLSLLSINLGIVNLLPLPVLDGGYLLLLIIEYFAGKNISKQIEKYTYHIGVILLILLTCLSIFNDLFRL